MARIGCNVLNCSHNDSGVCYANRISITGKKAHTSNHTCCSSFLDQSTYSNLTSNTCTNGGPSQKDTPQLPGRSRIYIS